MTKKELEALVKTLEERIVALEARSPHTNQYWPQYPYGLQPFQPYNPPTYPLTPQVTW